MTADERFVLETQTRAWLRAMRVQWVRRNGIGRGESTVPPWEELSNADRTVLMACQDAANKAGSAANISRLREIEARNNPPA